MPLRPGRRRRVHGAASSSAARPCPATATTARLGAHFLSFDYAPMRIVFDVSPLSHERTGVNNYIRGSLAGLAAAAQRDGRRGGRVRADLARGAARDPRGARGDPRRAAARHAARRARLAHRLVAARLAAGRALARRVRRAALHRLDVPAAARRPARDHDPRPRAAALPGVGHRPHALDARRASTRTPRAPAT